MPLILSAAAPQLEPVSVPKFLVWKSNAQGVIQHDNPGWGLFTGQSPAEYTGAGWLQAVHPDDREHVAQEWAAAVAQRSLYELRYRLRRRDGLYRDILCQAGPQYEGADIVAWTGICNDITTTLRAEAQRQAIEERLSFLDRLGEATRNLSDPALVMATVARLLGEHLKVTRCAYADVEADSNLFTIRNDWSAPGVASSAGTYQLELFGPQAVHRLRRGDPLVVDDIDRDLGADGGGRMFNAIGIKAIICAGLVKDNRLVAMMAVHQNQPRHWRNDDLALVAEVVERCWTHIERVRDHAKLREQDRRKDEFIATLAHELRNPLAPIRYAVALLRRSKEPSKQRQVLDVIDRQAGHLTRLVDDLLEVSRINQGLITLQRHPVAVASLLEQAAETVAPQLQAAGHRLEVRLPAASLTVNVDATRIVQVLANLLNNAIKYTPDGGNLRLAGSLEDDHVLLEVVDNGIGIPAADQARLFELFTQLPHTAHRAQGGLGIGLSLVRSLVELHGGQVHLESGGLDQGSRFMIRLPPALSAHAPEPGAQSQGTGTSDGYILIVEDNEDGREVLVALMEDLGYRVRAAADGFEALDIARTGRPWLVLLDIGLPGIDGYEVARRLRQELQWNDVKIVALTGWGSEQDRQRSAAAGFNAHFTKPFDPDELERFVAQVATDAGFPTSR